MMNEQEAKEFYSKRGLEARKKRIPDKNVELFLKNKQQKEVTRQIELLKHYFQPSFTICEIGASNGDFLEQAREYVNQVYAIELGEEEVKNLKAKKINHYSSLEDIDYAGLKFDAVLMLHLFEHLNEPIKYLEKLNSYLNDNALIFVEVPNIDDVLVSRYNVASFKKFYFQSMHCFYYNEQTLTNVFAKAGFKLQERYFVQRYPFSNHLQWLLYGQAGGNEEYERGFSQINEIYSAILKKEKITDTIICIFKK